MTKAIKEDSKKDIENRVSVLEVRFSDLNSHLKSILTVVSIVITAITIIVTAVGFFVTSQSSAAQKRYEEATKELFKFPKLEIYSNSSILDGKVFKFHKYDKYNSFNIDNLSIKNNGTKANEGFTMRLYSSEEMDLIGWEKLQSDNKRFKTLLFCSWPNFKISPKENYQIRFIGGSVDSSISKVNVMLEIFYNVEEPTTANFTIEN